MKPRAGHRRLALAFAYVLACRAGAASEPIVHEIGRDFSRSLDLRVDLLDRDHRVAKEGVPIRALLAKDRPTVVAFWASYCAPCLSDMEAFERLSRDGHRIVGVSLDSGRHDVVARLLRDRGVGYPNAILEESSMQSLGRALESGLPFTLVFDREGRVRDEIPGEVSAARIERAIVQARL